MPLFALLIGLISLMYATVGQAGGTAFLALMAFANFPASEMRPALAKPWFSPVLSLSHRARRIEDDPAFSRPESSSRYVQEPDECRANGKEDE